MSAIIRPAGAGDVEQIVALLAKMNAKFAPERWRRLFDYPWRKPATDFGRVAAYGGRVVGFVGMIYADRMIAGRHERVVNICAWYLDKDQRGRGLGAALMRDATADPAMSYTILTSSAKTPHILAAVGYGVLDDQRRIWRRRAGNLPAEVTVERDPARIAPHLHPSAQRLLADHAGLPVMPLLVRAAAGQVLVVVVPKLKAGGVRHWDVLHVGDAGLFTATAQGLANALIGPGEDAVLAADLRFVADDGEDSERERFAVPRFFKTARLARTEIDNLYSEVQLLDLKLD